MGLPAHLQPKAGLKLARADREAIIIPMLVAGESLRQVAAQVGVSHVAIKRDVDRIIQRWADEMRGNRNRYVWRLYERYEVLLQANWDNAIEGEPKAMDTVFRALKAQREMYGVNAPVKLDARVQDIPGGGEGVTLIDRMQQRYLQEQEANVVEGKGRSAGGLPHT